MSKPYDPLLNRRGRTLLGFGAVLGIMLGSVGVFDPTQTVSDTLPAGTIARVNGRYISAEDFIGAIAQKMDINGNEINEVDRTQILNRLIDKELLIQNAVEIGFIESELSIREVIFDAMVSKIVAESESGQPSDHNLQAFFEDQYGSHNIFLFEQVREQVVLAYKSNVADKALREYLDWLWEEADIALVADIPKPFINYEPGGTGQGVAVETRPER